MSCNPPQPQTQKGLLFFVSKEKEFYTWHALEHIRLALHPECLTITAMFCVPAEGTVERRGLGAALPVPPP